MSSGASRSCGCLLRDWCSETKTTHGMGNSPEYRIWGLIKDRCLNSRGDAYRHYGGRGIGICERWRDSFEAFYADMGPRPSPKHEVDRIDNDGHYEPSNCRWALKIVQANNKRNNVRLELDGETLTLPEWARRMNVSQATIRKRLLRGWDTRRAILTPYMGKR